MGTGNRILTACVLALGGFSPGVAGIGGVVLDAATGAPVAGASVRHTSASSGAITDTQGRFQLPSVSLFRASAPKGKLRGPVLLTFGAYLPPSLRVRDAAGRSLGPWTRSPVPAFLAEVPPAAPGARAGVPTVGQYQTGYLAKAAPAPCLLAVEAPAYKPREANCAEGEANSVSLAPESSARFFYQVPVEAGDGLAPGRLAEALPVPGPVLDLMDSLAARRFKEIHSLLIVKGGKLVLEEYYKGNTDTFDFEKGIKRMPGAAVHWTRTGRHYLASANKSLTSLLTGMALARAGKPVTTTLASLLPAYQSQFTGTKASITVENALTMTMGFQWDEWAGRDLADMWATGDIGAYVLAKPMAAVPGAQWIYNSAGPNLLLAALGNAVGGDMARFAADNLFGPLGIEDYRWGRQPGGLPEGSARMFMRPRDMAKLGLLVLRGGAWQGTQVAPADWVARSTRFQRSALPKNPNDYGYLWWVRKAVTPKGATVDYLQAEGDGGQYIVVLPVQDMVVVATGGNYGDFGTYDSQMGRMLARHILPGTGL